MSDMDDVNESIKKLQTDLINQLRHTNIEYIDLLTYYNSLEKLKLLKQTIFIDEMMRD